MRAIAAQDARHSPESVGDNADGTAGHAETIEGRVVVVRHARHDEGTATAGHRAERLDEFLGTTFHRCDPRKRRVNQQHAIALDRERAKLSHQLASGHLEVILHM
jgi:hypothetical protein